MFFCLFLFVKFETESGAFGFLIGEHLKAGANATIECLKRILESCFFVSVDFFADDRKPHKLYLQLDNTTKQNKSSFIFGYLAWLLESDQIIEEVIVSFLPVGHTHEDIDQLFSRLSIHLRSHDAHSRPELQTALESAYFTKEGVGLKTEYLDRLTNFSEWIKPYINKEYFKGLTAYQQFRCHTCFDDHN